jgi:CoA-transferase family III
METKGLLFGSIGLERARHVFLTVGIIDLLMSSAAWRGWSILRGDASNNAPESREMLVKMDHPTIGELPLVGSPLKMSETPVEYRLPPPLMGEHTEEVLRELGYENDEGRNV